MEDILPIVQRLWHLQTKDRKTCHIFHEALPVLESKEFLQHQSCTVQKSFGSDSLQVQNLPTWCMNLFHWFQRRCFRVWHLYGRHLDYEGRILLSGLGIGFEQPRLLQSSPQLPIVSFLQSDHTTLHQCINQSLDEDTRHLRRRRPAEWYYHVSFLAVIVLLDGAPSSWQLGCSWGWTWPHSAGL